MLSDKYSEKPCIDNSTNPMLRSRLNKPNKCDKYHQCDKCDKLNKCEKFNKYNNCFIGAKVTSPNFPLIYDYDLPQRINTWQSNQFSMYLTVDLCDEDKPVFTILSTGIYTVTFTLTWVKLSALEDLPSEANMLIYVNGCLMTTNKIFFSKSTCNTFTASMTDLYNLNECDTVDFYVQTVYISEETKLTDLTAYIYKV